MYRAGIYLLLMLLGAPAQGETVWKGTDAHSVVDGGGDVLDRRGAVVALSGQPVGKAPFIGAITSMDATAYKGRELRFAGRLRVDDGAGAAALWMRADGPKGPLAFASSGRNSVRHGDGPSERDVLIYVPAATSSLKFGVTLDDAGYLYVEDLRLTSAAAEMTGISAYDMMAEVLPFIREKALNAGNVSWPTEEATLLTDDLKNFPAKEAYVRLRQILDLLADRHSFLQTPKDALAYQEQAAPTRPIESRSIADIGYVLVPGLRGTGARDRVAFTAELCSRIATLAQTSSTGWILDLREDTGGNMWPMLNGLHSLLGDNEVGAFRNRDGSTEVWRSQASPECRSELSNDRVAVLVGPKTASSGEAVAVAFRGRPNTHFFGQPTAGLATSNSTFPLPDGGALLLTTGAMIDRTGAAYPKGIVPESLVASDQDAISMAAAWLRSMP